MTAPVSVTPTATVSACAVTPARVSVNTAAVPSVTGLVPAAMVTSGRSSSAMLSVRAFGGRTTVAGTDTVPDTVTCLSTVSTLVVHRRHRHQAGAPGGLGRERQHRVASSP